jgi:benzoate transport
VRLDPGWFRVKLGAKISGKIMSLASHIEQGPMSRFQVTAITICMIINMLDGFDVLVVAFTAPSIAADWNLSATAIGSLLSAGLIGMTAGSLLLGPLADRLGRRPMVLTGLVVISLGMVASAFTINLNQLFIARLVTGLGVGGILPSLNTIVSEYSSLRWRSFAVSFLQAGYPIGATLGGVIAAMLIAGFGWRAVYLASGLASTVLIFVVWWQLPESLDHVLTRRPPGALEKVNRMLVRLGQPSITTLPPVDSGPALKKTGYADLLHTPGLARTTALLCLCFFVVMLSFYFVLSWTPKLLVDAGMSTSEGISGGIILNVGGIVGSMLLGYISARIPISRLIALYMLVTAGLMVLFSTVHTFTSGTLALALALGFFIFGSMVGLYALSPHLYPARSRAAGLSIAIGLGRLGGVTSPLLAGFLFDGGWTRQQGFVAFAAPLLLSMLVVLMLRETTRERVGTGEYQ